jgi:hypothetical protein
MPWTPERTTINQRVQIGAESTSALGTNVSASKVLECFDVTFGINSDVTWYTGTGRKYPSEQEENTEWVDGVWAGNVDYNGIIYPLAGAMGSVAPVAHGVSTVAKDWVFTPPVTGSIVPQTYTVEQGDSGANAVRAHKANYVLFSSFGYTLTRKKTDITAKSISLPLTDNITMTASPTVVALAPVPGKHINVYLDSTSAGIGVTQLVKFLQVQFAFDNIYGPFWPLNRANAGYTAHVDLKPAASVKLKMEADSVGMGLLTNLQTGSTQYLRVQAKGGVIDNIQTVSLGAPSAGTFTLTYKSQTTTALAYNATSAAVQTAFLLLSTVGSGNATVSGGAGGPYTVAFIGTLLTDTTAMTGNGASLTGGTFLITQSQSYNTITHDMAIKIGKPTPFGDDAGIFFIEWDCMLVEDPNWNSGQAQTITVTNLITAL